MLTEKEVKDYTIVAHGLSISAREYIRDCRMSEPSRMVGIHSKSNVTSQIVSKKMNHSISVESRTAERAFYLLCEYDERVFEIWEQPQPVNILKTTKAGNKRKNSYTPDFLILTCDGPTVIEVKTNEELKDLLIKYPDDWTVDASGEYSYLPAIEAFSKLGLTHKTFVYSNKLRYLIANLEVLLKSRRAQSLPSNEENRVLDLFERYFVWSLYDLKNELALESYTPLIQLIDQKKIYFDQNRELLTTPKNCFVATSSKLLEPAKEYRDKRLLFKDIDTKHLSILSFPSAKVAKETLDKLRRANSKESSSSVRKWRRQIEEGREKNLTPFQSLVSKRHRSGNRRSKVADEVSRFVDSFIKNNYSKQQGISVSRSYHQYTSAAKEKHPNYEPVSLVTYSKRIAKIPDYEVALRKGGRRLANAAAEPTDPMQRSIKAKAAWQSVAIDHYLADIYLVFFSSSKETFVLRPWVTAMLDLYSSKILAVSISFQSPSRNSVAKIFRDCVRRHGKLPSEVIVDRGSDFTSVYFSSFLANYGVTLSLRPSGHSRWGGEIEGFFGEFKKQWLSQRQGNMNDYKNTRSIDGKLTPRNLAVMKPYDFYKELFEFCDWRDNKCISFNQYSANFRLQKSEKDYPLFAIPVEYNQDFIVASSVESSSYKIDLRRGIHIQDFWFSHPDLSKVRGKLRKLEVRIDPENPHVVYALVNNKWVSCFSSHINDYSAKDPVAQLVDGLIYREAFNARKKIRQLADEDLAKKVKEFESVAIASDKSSIASEKSSKTTISGNVTSIFKQVKTEDKSPVKVTYWRKK